MPDEIRLNAVKNHHLETKSSLTNLFCPQKQNSRKNNSIETTCRNQTARTFSVELWFVVNLDSEIVKVCAFHYRKKRRQAGKTTKNAIMVFVVFFFSLFVTLTKWFVELAR